MVVATATKIGDVLIFDLVRQPLAPPEDGRCRPEARLHSHTGGAKCLAWSSQQDGLIASGATDGRICLVDVAHGGRSRDFALSPFRSFLKPHGGQTVLDVALHP